MLAIKKTLNHPKADPEKRSIFCQKIADLENKEKPIVYIDESGFAHDMPRTHGYSIKGQRCYGKHDWGAKGRTNAKKSKEKCNTKMCYKHIRKNKGVANENIQAN